MWKTRLVSDGGLTRTPDGFDLDIRLPWYRSLPLSVFRGLTLDVDGESIAPKDMSLEINGKTFALDATDDEVDEWWRILKSGIVHVAHPALQAGKDYRVEFTFSFEIPYVDGGVSTMRCAKTLQAA